VCGRVIVVASLPAVVTAVPVISLVLAVRAVGLENIALSPVLVITLAIVDVGSGVAGVASSVLRAVASVALATIGRGAGRTVAVASVTGRAGVGPVIVLRG
jgi:hypothetical protein